MVLGLRSVTPPPSSSTEVIPTDKVELGFKDLDAAILVGSMPRKEGMERKDLLKANVAIFKTQGAALEKYAKKSVRVTVPLRVYDSACFRPLPQSSSSLAD
uniref:Malate dehydrogenase, cytoplasmic n=1 Tax=Salmo salar TaxID=8030 RepID=C0H9P0_SALSA|nr:Malate dehydrogenase, cytoplasmic [Salmo salar]